MTPRLANLAPNAPLSRNLERGNLNIQFGGMVAPEAPLVSDRWELGGRRIQFAQLAPNALLGLDQSSGRTFVKVIVGSLASPSRRPFCEPRGLQDTIVRDAEIKSGPSGALIAVFVETENAPKVISSMDQLSFSGPMADALQWKRFDDHFGQYTDIFNGVDAYIGPGFHLIDEKGDQIVFLNLWTAGKDVDLSTHNHSNAPSPLAPAFAEVHLTICNGTGKGGMYVCAEPGARHRDRFPMPAGTEHGPFFDFDPQSGSPKTLDNGAAVYPWHGWQTGSDDQPDQAYDFVAAFETTLRYAHVLT